MELKNNDLVKGSSGRFGDQLVYRQRGGKTIIARRPRKKMNPDSPRQLEIRELFAEAVLYAKSAIADEVKKAAYQAKARGNQTAFNLAFSDFYKATAVHPGLTGTKLIISAADMPGNITMQEVIL